MRFRQEIAWHRSKRLIHTIHKLMMVMTDQVACRIMSIVTARDSRW